MIRVPDHPIHFISPERLVTFESDNGEERNSSEETNGFEATTYLTRPDVARLPGVSPNTVTRWACEGRVPCQVTLGGYHRFDRAVIEGMRDSLYRAGWEELAEAGDRLSTST